MYCQFYEHKGKYPISQWQKMNKKVQFSFQLKGDLLLWRSYREGRAGRGWDTVQSIHVITNPTSNKD